MADGTKKEYRYCHCSCKKSKYNCSNRSVYILEDELLDQIKETLSKYTIDETFFKLAVEALAEQDDIEVAKQNENMNRYNRLIAGKKADLDNLRRSVYKGIITDNAFFLQEQQTLEDDIKALERERDKIMVAARDWRQVAMDVFMFARYAKEDFDSDDWEKKRTVIKALGADLKLSGRTIEFTPVKYLVPIENEYPKLKKEFEVARTNSQQRKNDLKEAIISRWYTRRDSNPRLSVPKTDALIH